MTTTTTEYLRAGTRIETHGFAGGGSFLPVAPEGGTIKRWTKVNGPRKAGWHIVLFDNGTVALCVHESGFRVVDNR